ncbi:IclR family transcriptional regulator [Herbiconiux daphne]|uniref:IclR family transcriptional regulator n=1 Tax=Herbiconiux daphne TaxID=2970914 RepID=A0ABT2H3Q7_9MICO|nr:IclR family transcriptional regulator [Herbiconiux daphne]MCS5734555.1 IclR family transcriptional regulator [Herbiconiux daphne]
MTAENPPLPPYAIESVDNALRLLLLFQTRQKLRVSDVSAELGVARSTAHRLLATMSHRGFVFQERGSRWYYLGKALLEIGLAGAGGHGLRMLARPHMHDLVDEVRETVNLLVLEGDCSRFIESVESDQLIRVASRTGTLLPAQSSSGGKVLLAGLSEEELETVFPNGFSTLTGQTIGSWDELRSELRLVRARGYATNRGETLAGLRAVAVPVHDRAGAVVAALAVSVPEQRGSSTALEALVAPLRRTADRIEQAH